jgi:hypothetical protein
LSISSAQHPISDYGCHTGELSLQARCPGLDQIRIKSTEYIMKKSLHRLLILAIIAVGMFVVVSNRKVTGQSPPEYNYGESESLLTVKELCWELCD